MEYEAFKEVLLTELRNFYGKDADAITVRSIKDTDGQYYEGIDISMQGIGIRDDHAVNLNVLYDRYVIGVIDLYDCVEIIYRKREGQEIPIKVSDNS